MRVKINLRRVCITIKMTRTPVSVDPVRSQHGSGVRKRKYICRKNGNIDSAVKLTTDAIRGEDLDVSLQNEMQHVKSKAADVIENIPSARKKQLVLKKVKPKFDFFGKTEYEVPKFDLFGKTDYEVGV